MTTTNTTPPPAYELWSQRVAALEIGFSATDGQLAAEIRDLDAALACAVDLDAAVMLIERRERARIRLAALQAVRKNALSAAREAAHEAGQRDDRLINVRDRLAQAVKALEGTRSSDERSNLERVLATLRQRLAVLEAEEAADVKSVLVLVDAVVDAEGATAA